MVKNIKKLPLKVLITAYACEPSIGSESSVGWEWALEIAKRGHNVILMTRVNNRKKIDNYFLKKEANIQGSIKFIYFDLPKLFLFIKKRFSLTKLYYPLWQYFSFKKIRRISEKENFDIVHHLTFVTLRHFSHLGNLGKTFILGPLSGGDSSPNWIRREISLNFWISELIRDFIYKSLNFDPFFLNSLKKASLIICTTPATKKFLPKKYHAKTKVLSQISMERPKKCDFKNNRISKNILYVGRFISLKGMSLGLESFALAVKNDPDLCLTMVGKGPQEYHWKYKAKKLGISERIKWLPWLGKKDLKKVYLKNSIFLFPSLHDSGGKVVFEAISKGLRVITLNIGGPGFVIDNKVGDIIEINHKNKDILIKDISKSINSLANTPHNNKVLFQKAVAHYEKWNISKTIDKIGIY